MKRLQYYQDCARFRAGCAAMNDHLQLKPSSRIRWRRHSAPGTSCWTSSPTRHLSSLHWQFLLVLQEVHHSPRLCQLQQARKMASRSLAKLTARPS